MRNLVPHLIQENYKHGIYNGAFPAVGLFLDISGFSRVTDALMGYGPHGAEVLASLLRTIFDPLTRNVYAQGGFIASMAGDAFTALFPVEGDEAQTAHRALAAAWRSQQEMETQAEHHTPYGNFKVQVKIGLAAGDVRWGIVRSKDGNRAAYYFQGPAVEACAQAEHLAQAGEIILDARVAHQVLTKADIEPVMDHHRLKGMIRSIPEPQTFQQPPPDPLVMARFLPKSLFSQVYSGEFRQVVNLFINLPTVRTESQLVLFMHSLFELQERYGGLLDSLDFGDKGSNALLFWGAPEAFENDIERALNFILALQPLTSIPINAGITYQIAHAGFIGSPSFEGYTCLGRGVNLAARFIVAAPRGEVWVDAQIAQRAKTNYLLEPVGEIAFKGFAEKQMVHILRERKEQAEAFFTGELIGRQAELKRLADFVEPLWQGKFTGVLVISGEPGIGKSRLAHAFEASTLFQTHPALWALCQTDATLHGSLNPFIYWMRRYFGQSEAVTETRNKRSFNLKVESLIEAISASDKPLADELDRVRSCLGALLGLHWADSLYEQLDPQGRYENTLISLTALLCAESLRQPVILFLEDVQWLDDDSKAYLPRLGRVLASDPLKTYPIAILATARGENSNDLLGGSLVYQALPLSGISSAELVSLASQLLEGPPSEGLIHLLEDRTEGNPFFVEQVLHYLQDERLLELGGEGWQLAKSSDRPPLPADVRALLAARLDRLGQEVKDVVQTASVLGREFEGQLLARMLERDNTLYQKVFTATQASIWSEISERRYLFKHALVQDAAYRMLVHSQRQSLHALAVTAIESVYAAELQHHYGELAYHSEKAGLVEIARRYLQLAGDAARDVYQNGLAIDYYNRALNLLPVEDLSGRYTLLLNREGVYNLLGDRDAQRKDLEALRELAATLTSRVPGAWQAEIGQRWANYANQIGDYAAAAAAAERAVSHSHEARAMETALRAHLTWAYALWRQGKYPAAIQQAEAGLELARQMGDMREQGRSLNTLGLIAMEQKGYINARRYLQAALSIAQEARDRETEASVLNNLGNLAGASGDYIMTISNYQRAIQVLREIGQRPVEGRVLGNLGWVVGTLGDYGAARSYCEQNLLIACEAGDRHNEAYALVNLSAFTAGQGEHATAQAYAERSLSIARETGDPSCESWALTYLGHALLGSGRVEASQVAYNGALDIRRTLGQPNLATEPLAGLARCELARGDSNAAMRFVQEIWIHLYQGGNLDGTDEPLRVYLTLYNVLLTAQDPRAQETLEEAYQILQRRASKIKDAAIRRTFMENVPYHKEILIAWNARPD